MNKLMPTDKRHNGRPTVRPTHEKLAELYWKYTATEIAEMYNVSVPTVRAWIKYYRKQENHL